MYWKDFLKPKTNNNVDTTKTTHISLCSGYGGIDLGLRRVIPNLRTVAYAEIEAFACENLLARMEGGQLDAAPIWSNLKSFPWAEFSGLVDILSSGYPCQPFSAAGKRAGKEDPRHLWPWITDGIRILRPRMCFFENVEGHISLGLSTVISDLEELGYKVSWGIFSASEVGACHKRARVFIFADSMCKRGFVPTQWIKPAEQDAGGEGSARRTEDGLICNSCGDGIFEGCGCYHGESQCPFCGEWTYPFFYEPSTDGCQICGSQFPEWSDYRSWPIVPFVRGGNDGVANRVDRLRLLGNGVVPATAEKAFRTLMQTLHE